MLLFNKTMLLSKLQRQPISVLRTNPSGPCFGLVRVLNPIFLSGATLTLLPVKSCLQVGVSIYFTYTVFVQFILIS